MMSFRQKRSLFVRLFFENGMHHWKNYALAFVFMALVAIATGLTAWIMRDLINEIFLEHNQAMIMPIAAAIFFVFLVKGLASYAQVVILSRTGNQIVADIQARLFDHVLSQRIDFFEKFSIGDLATRFSHNAQSAREAINLVVTSLGRDLLSVIALTVVMVVQNPSMSAVALLIAPPAILGVTVLVRQIKAVARAEFLSLARIVTIIQESAIGVRIVKTFALEPTLRDEMHQAIDGVRLRANKMAKIGAATSPLMETLGGLAIAMVVIYAGSRVIEGGADPGAFFSFITALLLAYEPAKRIARLNVNLQAHMVGVELMYQLLDELPKLTEASDAKPLKKDAYDIAFENVHFKYGDAVALEGVNFEAPAGETTALVGPSGGGKSTIFALIERFYDPSEGRVTIGGQDLKATSFESLRNAIASVSQQSFLFDGSVQRNIGFGRQDAGFAEIVEAAKAANMHSFIESLPEGYDTRVGEDGAMLSGGQRQRLAIARAMLRDAPILLLDEATAALDSETEARVAEALDRLKHGRTTIAIAHRLSTVRHAALIHVVDQGQIVQSGSHEELMRSEGLYQHLYSLQFNDVPEQVAADA